MNSFKESKKVKKKNSLTDVSQHKFDVNIDNNIALKYVPFFVFLTFLGVIYIACSYYSEKQMSKITVLEKEVERLRVDYSSLKYEYIYASKRAEIAKKVKALGLFESDKPATKIIIKE